MLVLSQETKVRRGVCVGRQVGLDAGRAKALQVVGEEGDGRGGVGVAQQADERRHVSRWPVGRPRVQDVRREHVIALQCHAAPAQARVASFEQATHPAAAVGDLAAP